ncbi:MAG: LiaF transmembrane domain-containing protein [Massilia sp.]
MRMDSKQSYQWRKQLMWGLVLVAFGVGLLLDQMGKLDILSLWHYLPLLMLVIGINKMIGYPTADEFTEGLWWLIIGGWLFGNLEHIFGMHFESSWPYLIIAWGLTLILKPLMRQRLADNERKAAPPVHGE